MVIMACLLFSLFASQVSALSIMIQSSGEECFFDTAQRGEKVYGSFLVYAGGALDIDVSIDGPDGRTVYSEERLQEQSFSFIAMDSGMYKLCFSNTKSTVTTKMISFNLQVGNSIADHEIAKEEHLTPLENSVILLAQSSKNIKDELRYLKVRDRASRRTNDSTHSRVIWTNIIEMLILVGVSLGKLYYIRTLFQQKP